MQFYDVIQSRTSVKRFKSTPIDKEKLARMVNAAMLSPSWKNHTSYKFILVDDPKEKELLAQAIMNDTNEAAAAIKEAPMAVVVVGAPADSGIVEGREYYLVDGAIALEHFVLAATNEGYGTCWIASVDENKISQVLSIPNNYKVVAMTPIGEVQEKKEHYPEKDIGNYVFVNRWDNAYTENMIQ